MGAATALTEAERQEQMFADAKRQWAATNAAIRARRLHQRILKAVKQGLHRLQVGHPERVALRTLSFPSGRKIQVCKLDNLSDATSEMDRLSAPWT
jgi:beta-glucosidase-like glycosyl hydrolase